MNPDRSIGCAISVKEPMPHQSKLRPRWNQMFRAPREMSVFADGIVCVP